MTHEGQHKFNNFTPVTGAMELAEYVFKITDNPNKFKDFTVKDKKNEDGTISRLIISRNDSLTNRVRDMANEIFLLTYTSNEIDLRKQPERKEERLSKQIEAIRLCSELLAEIQLCRMHFHMDHKRVLFWGEKVRNVRAAIEKWHESDKDRYKDI